jgi:hypothetical protein
VRALVAPALLLLVTGLSACSGDGDETYCETLREERRELDGLADEAGDKETDVVGGTLDSLRRLREVAPAELEDEYTTVVYAWEALVDAVEEAGIDPAEFDRKATLRELPARDARRVRQTAGALGAQRVVDATKGIEDHGLQVCEVDFRA